MLKEDKVFSVVYIAGTAVAIASAMVILMAIHVLTDNVGPEVRRDRTVYLGHNYTEKLFTEMLPQMESVEAFTTTCKTLQGSFQMSAEQKPIYVFQRAVDEDFFKIYDMEFIAGSPRNFNDDPDNVIVTDELAMYLFGTTDSVIGREINIWQQGRIAGVVKHTSPLLRMSYANIYSNRSSLKAMDRVVIEEPHLDFVSSPYWDGFNAVIMLKEGYDLDMFRQEWKALKDRRLNMLSTLHGISQDDLLDEMGFARYDNGKNQLGHLLNKATDDDDNVMTTVFYILICVVIFILMLLPAINLSGLVSNRMEDRLPEMGIRKAFGAGRWQLLRQVLWENLLLTSVGGALGFILAIVFINYMKASSLMRLVMQVTNAYDNDGFDASLFVSPKIFLFAFLCCALLNIMVALIPAIRSLRKPIVISLNQKK